MKIIKVALLFLALFQVAARSTDVQVVSSDRNLFSEDQREKSERLTFYKDDSASIDVNENGEPNWNMHF